MNSIPHIDTDSHTWELTRNFVDSHHGIVVMHVSSFPEMSIVQSDPVGCSP